MGSRDDSWRKDAACRGKPTAMFFLESGPEERVALAAAKEICASCAVRRCCLEAGMSESRGIWGGLTPPERRRLRNEQKGAVA
jgi:WhiB family transcriptional regulator, redox-sensing transcriptional regulator